MWETGQNKKNKTKKITTHVKEVERIGNKKEKKILILKQSREE